MSLADVWYRFKLLHLSKPAGERPIFKAVRGRKINSILEVGLGDGERTERLLGWLKHLGTLPGRYAAIDGFESAGSGNISLKAAHRLINSYGMKPCFVPGEFSNAALRVAHTVGACDLVILADAQLHPSKLSQPDKKNLATLLSRLVTENGLLIARDDTGTFQIATCPRPAASERRMAA